MSKSLANLSSVSVFVLCCLAQFMARADDLDLDRPATPPAEAIKLFAVAEGLEASLLASEPEVAQPVTMSFDDRGRMWVVQYLQYPHPAGLRPVEVDQYLRTKYDHVPDPPPKGPKGKDRITIYEDTDGDGRPDRIKDFIAGLNLCSGLALGHGGAFVLQSPYLLFYPDRNNDDVPDSDPQVLLSGFGMEDAHAVASSLTWGPDGWLYGVQGSTVTANIRGIEFQQGVWRYHPLSKKFELFSEGGGNNFGFDFDRYGNAFAAGNEPEPICHHVQGGYYVKGFSKHGPLHNPYTYGYFQPTPHQGYMGDSLSAGFSFYFADVLPQQFHGAFVAPHTRHSASRWATITTRGSTFQTHDGGNFLSSSDQGFRPVDMTVGPDGAVYIADWYDLNISHSDPRDRSKYYPPRVSDGRIWKVTKRGAPSRIFSGAPLRERSTNELVDLLSHPNDWYAREARNILAERKDAASLPRLRNIALQSTDEELALQAVFAYYVTAGLDPQFMGELLNSRHQYVRAWAIRLLGDEGVISGAVFADVVRVAREDAGPVVQSQIASTAKRLGGEQALALLSELIRHDESLSDAHIPLLVWWAFADKALVNRGQILNLVTSHNDRDRPLVREVVAPRLVRRYTAENNASGFESCARMLAAASDPDQLDVLLTAIDEQLIGQVISSTPIALKPQLDELIHVDRPSQLHLRVALRLGYSDAVSRSLKVIASASEAEADRLKLIGVVGESKVADGVPTLLEVLRKERPAAITSATMQALSRFDRQEIGASLVEMYPRWEEAQQREACDILCSRSSWALAILRAIDAAALPKTALSPDQLRRIQLYQDQALDALIAKLWGKVTPMATAEAQKRIVEVIQQVNSHPGKSDAGRIVFANTCSKCHQLFGEGTPVGPDLTGVERRRLDVLVANVVEPSSVIRPEYQNYVAFTVDGLTRTGVMVDSSPETITLLDGENKRTTLSRNDIERITPSPISVMPEKLLDNLSPQQTVDLIAYLRSDQPK